MELSHVLYKVDDLDAAVNEFRNKGFNVVYSPKREAHHAFVYFLEGPYLEIIHDMAMTGFVSFMLRCMGYKEFVKSMKEQEQLPPGYIRFAFKGTDDKFAREKEIYIKYGYQVVIAPVQRKDADGNVFKCKCLFPAEGGTPFVKSKYSRNIEHQDDIKHKNGAKGIKKILYRTSVKNIKLIYDLGGADMLDLEVGEPDISVEFKY